MTQVYDITDRTTWNALKDYYDRNGYVIIESGLNADAVKALSSDLDEWFEEDSFPSDNCAMKNDNRIQDAWRFDNRIKSFATDQAILKLLKHLYGGKKVKPFQTLNFRNGTQQPVHSDSIHFNSEPFGMMCGVWLALEDIDSDQGPLVYYPESHKYPEMNYKELGLEPKGGDFKEYSEAIKNFTDQEQLVPAYATLKQGQALIWSANLLHGGSIRENDKTRLSQVTHYYVANCKYWRPSQSYSERCYFTPDWLPLTGESIWLKNITNMAERLTLKVRKKLNRIGRH